VPADESEVRHPRLVRVNQHDELAGAFSSGGVVAVPAVGGYALAVKAGMLSAEAHLNAVVTDPDGPHYQVANGDAVRTLTSGWSDEVQGLLERCWPGPLELFLPRAVPGGSNGEHAGSEQTDGAHTEGEDADGADADGEQDVNGAVDVPEPTGGWAIVVGTPEGRALRRLCKEQGPWRTAPLAHVNAEDVVRAFDASDVALVVDGGDRTGDPPTLVDATATPLRVLREGALPAHFVEGAMLMGSRRRGLFHRGRGQGRTS
jgi:tRNA A37 threonylcarbamoyladenosine synthetase subunit TsaC/SUA5/YrdC